jgi:23S rRNA pseudouridine1911/1915/1917 synthase
LFGKTSKGASRLSEQFRNHTIQKTYHAIVVGRPKEEKGSIKEKVNKISFFAEGFTNKTDEELLAEIKKATKTRTAELEYEVVPMPEASRMLGGEATDIKSGKYSLLKILPKTGRFHQIRIQMTNMGCPILGDAKYSSQKSLSDNSIALSATAISFKTATEDKNINLEIPLPEGWKKFI